VPDDADCRDLAIVKGANPATWITKDLLRERFESPGTTDVNWRRFSANQWVLRAEIQAVIDTARWLQLIDQDAVPLPSACFAVDASMDRSSAAIAVAALLEDERALLDVVEHGSGIAWALESLVDLCRRHDPVCVVVDPGGPAGALIPRLQEYAIVIAQPTTRDVAGACGSFYDEVVNGTLVHRGSEPLTASLSGAVKRNLSQAWAFDRKRAVGDPSPLMAATLALWGLRTHGPLPMAAMRERFGD